MFKLICPSTTLAAEHPYSVAIALAKFLNVAASFSSSASSEHLETLPESAFE